MAAFPGPQSPGSSPAPDIYQSGPSVSDQFIRKWSLTLLGANGQSWTLSDSTAANALSGGTTTVDDPLRVTFQTRQTSISSRGSLLCRIYNLSRSHPAAGLAQLYNRVVLRAGYINGKFATIFDGSIINFRQGREPTLTETFLEITAQDGDNPYNLATASASYKAGTTVLETVQSLAKTMTAFGATLGKIVGLTEVPFIRGVVHYGQTLDQLLKYGQTFIQNRVLNVAPADQAFRIGDPVTVNAQTGLIGMAEITGPNGVEFDVNLNPTLQVHGMVTLDNKDVNITAGGNYSTTGIPGTQGPGYTQLGFYVDPSADGTYIALVIEHSGDSRGNEWKTHVVAWPNGAAQTPDTTVFQQYDLSPTAGQIITAVDAPDLPADQSSGSFGSLDTP